MALDGGRARREGYRVGQPQRGGAAAAGMTSSPPSPLRRLASLAGRVYGARSARLNAPTPRFDDVWPEQLGEPRSRFGVLALFAGAGLLLGGVGTFAVAAAWVVRGPPRHRSAHGPRCPAAA